MSPGIGRHGAKENKMGLLKTSSFQQPLKTCRPGFRRFFNTPFRLLAGRFWNPKRNKTSKKGKTLAIRHEKVYNNKVDKGLCDVFSASDQKGL